MPDPRLLRVCGIVALVAAALPVPCDIVSWLLAENYSPARNSISALAVGPSRWLIDLGLWCFVLASLAVAVGLWAWRIRARFWMPAIVSLALAGICVGIIARANEYAGTSNPGANLHLWAVVALGGAPGSEPGVRGRRWRAGRRPAPAGRRRRAASSRTPRTSAS